MKKLSLLLISALMLFSCAKEKCPECPVCPNHIEPTQPTEPVKPKELKLNVMSFNIRYDNYNDIAKGHGWISRRDKIAKEILFQQVDILGTQEVLHNQLVDLELRLPGYGVIGVGREDGKEMGEYSALWYNKTRFTLLKSGTFWLSATPDVAGSKGWDGACERIATWGMFTDKESNKNFFVLNTHLDHVGPIARSEGVKLIQQRLKSLSAGLPFIITGDFNSDEKESPIVELLKDTSIKNAHYMTDNVYGPSGSFHDWGTYSRLIDYIFVRKDCKVLRWGVLEDTESQKYLSDHYPILATIKY